MTDDEILARWEEVPWDNRQPHPRGIIAFARAIAAAEREECARVCDGLYNETGDDMTPDYWVGIGACAASIRARGDSAPAEQIHPVADDEVDEHCVF